MAYQRVTCRGTEYSVDWEVVERFCMSYWRTYYPLCYLEETEMSESAWYNPFSWSLPKITTIDVEWDKVRAEAHSACVKDMFGYSQRASSDMRGVAYEVKWKVEQTAVNKRKLANKLRNVQSANMAEIARSVNDYDGLISASKFVRNTSADILVVGSTLATGGAAAGLLGASSALKGLGKYQDTGKAGSAVLYGVGSMALGAFKLGGAKLKQGQEVVLIIAQGSLETGTSLMAGDTFAKAIGEGGLKVASAGPAQALFSSAWVKSVFSKMPIPFTVFPPMTPKGTGWSTIDAANELVEGTAKKLTERGAKTLIKWTASVANAPAARSATNVSSAGLANEAPIEDMLLLYFAIVNMNNGIGQGW